MHLLPLHERSEGFARAIIQREINGIRERLHIAVECTGDTIPRLIGTRYPDNIRGLLTTFDLAVGFARSEVENGEEIAATTVSGGQDVSGEGKVRALHLEGRHIDEALSHNALRRALESSDASEEPDDSGHIVRIDVSKPDSLRVAEKEILRQVLRMKAGNQVQAAAHLGISRGGLRGKMQFHGFEATQS